MMQSQAEITRQYEKLRKDVLTKEFYTRIDLTNRVNCYVCKQCSNITKTIDRDAGVTPFMTSCEKCDDMATSTMYRDIAPNLKPTVEWYRPSLQQVLKMRAKPNLLQHVLQGGLDCRPIS